MTRNSLPPTDSHSDRLSPGISSSPSTSCSGTSCSGTSCSGNQDQRPEDPPLTQEDLAELEQVMIRVRRGDSAAVSQLVELAYQRLYRIAQRIAGRNVYGTPTLHATALVSEGLLRLYQKDDFANVRDIAHFYAQFTVATRHAAIDYFRHKNSQKRGAQLHRLPLEWVLDEIQNDGFDPVELQDEIDALRTRDPRCASAMELFYFGRFTQTEIANLLKVSRATIENDLRFGRAYFRDRLQDSA